MLLTKKTEINPEGYDTLEPGVYAVELDNVEERASTRPNEKGEIDPWLLWKFAVVEEGYDTHPNGEQRYVWTTSSTKTGIHPVTKKPARAIQFVEALLGRSLEDGETADMAELIGSVCMASVITKFDEKGNLRNNIDSLSPVRKGKGAAAPAQAKATTPIRKAVEEKPTVPYMEVPELKGRLSAMEEASLTEELEEGTEDETPEPTAKQLLSLPRRRSEALAELNENTVWASVSKDAAKGWWEVEIHGEAVASIPFAKRTPKAQYKEVLQLESWAQGAEDLPIPF